MWELIIIDMHLIVGKEIPVTIIEENTKLENHVCAFVHVWKSMFVCLPCCFKTFCHPGAWRMLTAFGLPGHNF